MRSPKQKTAAKLAQFAASASVHVDDILTVGGSSDAYSLELATTLNDILRDIQILAAEALTRAVKETGEGPSGYDRTYAAQYSHAAGCPD